MLHTVKQSPVIIACDYDCLNDMWALLDSLEPSSCAVKIGSHMFTRFGPDLVKSVISKGFRVFLDLKYYDIPQTVSDACKAAADLGVSMVSVHALGGIAMLRALREAVPRSKNSPKILAITILTSYAAEDMVDLGFQDGVSDLVVRLAQLAKSGDCDGVVCSGCELAVLRQTVPNDFLLVTPGIRLDDSLTDDQKRVMTPQQAIECGANYLVIGRPITTSPAPSATLQKILKSIQ